MRALDGVGVLFVVFAACSGDSGGIPLAEVHDDAFGYAIKVPKGATQTEHEKNRHVWSWSPDQNVNSYHCIIEPEPMLEPFAPDAARKRVAEIRAPGDIKAAQALGTDGVLVELAEDAQVHYRESWAFRRGKTNMMVAICTGPAKGTTVTDMATSLRATQ